MDKSVQQLNESVFNLWRVKLNLATVTSKTVHWFRVSDVTISLQNQLSAVTKCSKNSVAQYKV